MDQKIKILTLSDHPMLPSGVGTQTKYVLEALLKTGKFQVYSLGGAVQHESHDVVMHPHFKQDWIMHPVDGYGTKEILRDTMRQWKPDIVYFMTDPRFWDWLWEMEQEIRSQCSLLYYHVWDNYPLPMYNRSSYESNDFIASISKLTQEIVEQVAPNVSSEYVPHAVDHTIFKNIRGDKDFQERIRAIKEQNGIPDDRTIFFWNNRNARRKQSGSLVYWYKRFLEKNGYDKTTLILHTDPNDVHGQPLNFLQDEWEIPRDNLLLHSNKVQPQDLNFFYNMADCTINISDAEGFGLATLESLSAETPIIVNMTGGLQEQVTDGENWFGIGLKPCSQSVIGSGQTPYIFEDRISEEQFVGALEKFMSYTDSERKEMGSLGKNHVEKNYNFLNFESQWVRIMESLVEKNGRYGSRKNFQSWEIAEI